MQLKPLTNDEKNILLPKIIMLLKKTNKTNTMYAEDFISIVRNNSEEWGYKSNFSQSRLRKLINHIRLNGILPVISGKHGYYISHEKEEIHAMIKSLEERAESILSGAKGLKNYLLD